MSEIKKLKHIHENTLAAMVQSGDPVLKVIVDMEPVSREIFNLVMKYSDAETGEENIPSPVDFLVGMAILFSNQFTIYSKALFSKDEQENLKDLLIGIVASPIETIMNDLFKNAGILDTVGDQLTEYEEILKQWPSLHPNSESKSQPQNSNPE